MKQLIKEIKSSLENKNYLSALALTLTLPDICGKISYPEIQGRGSVRKRYERWYNEYIYPYELSPQDNDPFHEWVPDGFAIYKLRCSLFHDRSLDINQDVKRKKGLDDSRKYKFTLTNNVTSYRLLEEVEDKNKEPSVSVEIGVKNFCEKICAVVDNVYGNHKDIYNDVIMFDFD